MKKNSKPPKKFPVQKKFKFPDTFYNQLNEFTGGGYALLYLNADGNPQVVTHYDTSAAAMAVVTFGQIYFNTKSEVQTQIIQESLLGDTVLDAPSEEEDDSGDDWKEAIE